MTTAASVEGRVAKLETNFEVIKRDVHTLSANVTAMAESNQAFHEEWRRSKEQDAKSRADTLQASRITWPQIVTMAAALFAIAAGSIGGGMYLIRAESNAVRLEIQAAAATTALQVRGQQDSIVATQTGLQSIQRDMGTMAVKVGLVELTSQRNAEGLKEMSSYDAHIARQEERTRALQDEVRAMAQRLAR